MPDVSILVPFGAGDTHRERAWSFVKAHYERTHPDWELIVGSCDGEWSKGAAVADAYTKASGDVFVIADADSFLSGPAHLNVAVESLAVHPWVTPHSFVYRLTPKATERVYAGGEPHPKLVRRRPYIGPHGGGIVVLPRAAYEEVRGMDERYKGWGGEDVSFGWALMTLVGAPLRLDGDLWHLDHPHPAPKLRGSPESEALVDQYKQAVGIPRLMRALVERREPDPVEPLVEPARFRSAMAHRLVRLGTRQLTFYEHEFATTDPDVAEALRRLGDRYEVEEVTDDSVCHL